MTQFDNEQLGTKTPHSGDLPESMRELPVEEFGSTTLSEANRQGLITIPDAYPGGFQSSPVSSPESQPDVKKGPSGKVKGLALGFVGLLAAGGAGTYFATRGGGEPTEPIALPGVSAPETPGAPVSVAPIDTAPVSPSVPSGSVTSIEVPKTVPVSPELTPEQKIAAIEIHGGLSDEQTAATYTERLSKWMMDGATEENYQAWKANIGKSDSISAQNWAKNIAAKNAIIYTDALFGSSNAMTAETIQILQKRNADAVWAYFLSRGDNSANKADYAASLQLVSSTRVQGQPGDAGGQMTITIRMDDNSGLNLGDKYLPDGGLDGKTMTVAFAYNIQDETGKTIYSTDNWSKTRAQIYSAKLTTQVA